MYFLKSIEKIQFSLKSGKNNGNFTLRPIHTYDHISFSSSGNERCFRKDGEKKIHILSSMAFFFENCVVYDRMWKNIVQSDRPQITEEYGACALHA